MLFWVVFGEALCYHCPRAQWVGMILWGCTLCQFYFVFFVLGVFSPFYVFLFSIVVPSSYRWVFCCGCSFLFSIVWFCLCFNDFYCVILKCFSVISFLYCIIIFLSLAGVWFYTSFDDSFYTFVLTLTAPVQLVTIVYV